jgi:hypothetical protein
VGDFVAVERTTLLPDLTEQVVQGWDVPLPATELGDALAQHCGWRQLEHPIEGVVRALDPQLVIQNQQGLGSGLHDRLAVVPRTAHQIEAPLELIDVYQGEHDAADGAVRGAVGAETQLPPMPLVIQQLARLDDVLVHGPLGQCGQVVRQRRWPALADRPSLVRRRQVQEPLGFGIVPADAQVRGEEHDWDLNTLQEVGQVTVQLGER